MDSEKREIYDKLGPEAAASKHPFNENTMLIEVQCECSTAVCVRVGCVQGVWRLTRPRIQKIETNDGNSEIMVHVKNRRDGRLTVLCNWLSVSKTFCVTLVP